MQRAKLNLVLAVVAVGLGVAVFFSQEKEKAGPPLTSLKPQDVTQIRLAHPNARLIRLEKVEGSWRLVEPVQGEADEFEVNALVGLADRETKETLSDVKLAELGLEPPQYTLTLNDVAIDVGIVEPLQYRRYVRVGGAVHLIEDPPSAALDREYADLVAKKLFPDGIEPTRVELPKLTLAKDQDHRWTATPADPKATADGMQKVVDGWKNARSMWNEMAAGAPPKGDRVTVALADGTTREFVIAALDPQFKLHRPDLGVNFVLSKALADELLKLPEPPKEAPKQEGAGAPAASSAPTPAPAPSPEPAKK